MLTAKCVFMWLVSADLRAKQSHEIGPWSIVFNGGSKVIIDTGKFWRDMVGEKNTKIVIFYLRSTD